MTAKMFTTAAAGAIFATASVFAPAAFAQSATQPADNSAPAMKTAPATSATAPAATTNAAASGSYLTQQSPDQISANTYIGQSVYNGNNESIGEVNDLIMEKQGGIVAAVIGVGGFLGIGQKNVAVPISSVTLAQNTQDGSVKLTTSETVDTLKAAPEFKTLAMQSAEKAPTNSGAGVAPATDNTSTGSTTNN
ncbi:PRC-barrel domain-containing protein [Rhizobium tubonense]|uniref:Photosystem reaction center subunit H n=1 Tax=Rhizobium tubonense TaxID=484088 RepID=A0A2W4C1M0_9HYPH|nr:PRC-barrel domain-containing protein [Rhizobium tubonense]PZM07749.1 photosystem reaction center subunit H [Rhizobium tubonense]